MEETRRRRREVAAERGWAGEGEGRGGLLAKEKKTERKERKGKTSLQELANAPRVTAVTQQYNPITLSCNPTFPLPPDSASAFFLLSTPSPLLVSTTNLPVPPPFLFYGCAAYNSPELQPYPRWNSPLFCHSLASSLVFSDLLLTEHRMLSLSLFYSHFLRQLSLLTSRFASPLFSLSLSLCFCLSLARPSYPLSSRFFLVVIVVAAVLLVVGCST